MLWKPRHGWIRNLWRMWWHQLPCRAWSKRWRSRFYLRWRSKPTLSISWTKLGNDCELHKCYLNLPWKPYESARKWCKNWRRPWSGNLLNLRQINFYRLCSREDNVQRRRRRLRVISNSDRWDNSNLRRNQHTYYSTTCRWKRWRRHWTSK